MALKEMARMRTEEMARKRWQGWGQKDVMVASLAGGASLTGTETVLGLKQSWFWLGLKQSCH